MTGCDFFRTASPRCRCCGGTQAEKRLECRLLRERMAVRLKLTEYELNATLRGKIALTEKANREVAAWLRE